MAIHANGAFSRQQENLPWRRCLTLWKLNGGQFAGKMRMAMAQKIQFDAAKNTVADSASDNLTL